MDKIAILQVKENYQPRETLCGSIEWSCNVRPDSIEIRLFWIASGAGPRQIGRVNTIVLNHPGVTGTSRFEFVLPAAPWSFQGVLSGLTWAVEAVIIPSAQNAHAMFSLLPKERARLLHSSEGVAE